MDEFEDFAEFMAGRPEGFTALQWYWSAVILSGMEQDLIPMDMRLYLNPTDPQVQQAMEARMPASKAAALVFRRVH